MNIETLRDHINTFEREVIDSGLKRDLDDYTQSLAASEGNILALREIAGQLLNSLNRIYSGDLPDSLSALLPGEGTGPFTDIPYNTNLEEIIENKEITQVEFFGQLSQLVAALTTHINKNSSQIETIEE